MRRPGRLIGSAWLIYLIAWFVPVHEHGMVRFPGGLPGWEAFRVAFNPIWPYNGPSASHWYGAVLSSSSALTNLVLLASIPVALRSSSLMRTRLAWMGLGSGVINALWMLDGGTLLRIGYYLWWASFIVLAAGLFRMGRGERGHEQVANFPTHEHLERPGRRHIMESRAGRMAVWVLSGLLAAMFMFAGMTKLLGAEGDIRDFAAWRYPDWFRLVIGAIEVVSAVLLLIPRAGYLGAAGISGILLWAGYTFVVRVPEESGRAPLTLTLLAMTMVVWYARRDKGFSSPRRVH
jgi:putative oxidoreductase